MNLAVRDVRHNLGRFALTCVGLGLLLGVVLSMIGIYRGLVDDALRLVRTPAADLWVVEAGTNGPFAEASRIPEDTKRLVARIYGVRETGALTFQSIETNHQGRKLRLYVVGFEPGRPGGPGELVGGRYLNPDNYELIADVETGLRLDERLTLGRRTFTVVGLTKDQVSSGGDPLVYIQLRDSQRLQFELVPAVARREAARGAPPASTNVVNAVVARVEPQADPDQAAEAVRRWKHLSALTQAQQETILTRSVVERARLQIGLFTMILITVSAVLIALIIYTMTMDKVREIATLKLIGAPDRTIIGLIIQEAVMMALIGLATGATLINLVKDYFPRRVILQPADGLTLAAVILIVCLLASGLGVRLALKIDPAVALGG